MGLHQQLGQRATLLLYPTIKKGKRARKGQAVSADGRGGGRVLTSPLL
jgi:hypothetical protein